MSTRFARISLSVWIVVLLALALSVSRVDVAVPVWDVQDTSRLLGWLADRVLLSLAVVLLFLPLGVLSVGALVPLDASRGRWSRRGRTAGALALAVAVAALIDIVRGLPPLGPPTLFGVCLPVCGCVLGTWIGSRVRRGKLRRIALETSVALVVLGTAAFGTTWLALSEEPLAFETPTVTSEDKRQLVGLVRGKNPRKIQGDDTRTLSFTQDETNRLLAWGLSVGSEGRKARVQLDQGSLELSFSLKLPRPVLGRQYLNYVIEEHAGFDRGLFLKTTRLDVGRLSVPRWTLAVLSWALVGELERDDHVRPLLEAVRHSEIAPNGMSVTYGRVEVPETYTADVLARFGRSDSEVAATQAQVDQLVETALSGTERLSFARCFESAFRLARLRSVDGDPVLENRAAVLALGIMLGHHCLRAFVGPVDLSRVPGVALYQFSLITLRGRRDWTQHFTVSAALKLLSNTATSNAIGLLKEELDAGDGGSGFSFGDLLADRAGTTFARVAVRNRESAASLQEWIGEGFRVDDFFPPAADLPEGIPDAELQRAYGGVGGERYRQLTDEIERRIAGCAAYRGVAVE